MGYLFPINKGIWTSTFVLFSTGWDLLIIAALILIVEIANIKGWTYFLKPLAETLCLSISFLAW